MNHSTQAFAHFVESIGISGDNAYLPCAGHPEFTVSFQHALNEYRVANGSMTESEKVLAEEDMLRYPVTQKNAQELARVLQLFMKGPL